MNNETSPYIEDTSAPKTYQTPFGSFTGMNLGIIILVVLIMLYILYNVYNSSESFLNASKRTDTQHDSDSDSDCDDDDLDRQINILNRIQKKNLE